MANTFSQIYIHLVFSPKHREALIKKEWKDELEKYITGIVQGNKHKMMAIYAMPDHIHILVGYNVVQRIPDLVEQIKTSTNAWINEKGFSKTKFDWQKGYGAFSHSKDNVSTVINYILNQKEHHQKKSFKTEYLNLLHKLEIDYNEKYVFDFILEV